MRVQALTDQRWDSQLAELLEMGVFPFGQDRFRMQLGSRPLAHLEHLGTPYHYTVEDQQRLLAIASISLRKLPRSAQARPQKVWYCARIKIHPDADRVAVAVQLGLKALPRRYLQCRQGYGITVCRPDRPAGRVQGLFAKLPFLPVGRGPRLQVFGLDAAAMRAFEPRLRRLRGSLEYLSLAGRKDLVLESSGQPAPLLHAQFGPCAVPGRAEPREGFLHLFCAPEQDPLAEAARDAGHAPLVEAELFHHRMSGWDWSFVLSSDF